MAEQHRLWVVESNGTPRSGKGTITTGLAEVFPGSAKDETGADYRAVTFGLMHDGILDPEMDRSAVATAIQPLSVEDVSTYAARRYEILAEHGKDALHTSEVGGIVKYVSPHDIVREAVKKGFAQRVAQHVANEDTHLLFVDGRNLTKVIKTVPGARLLLRQFVVCQPAVAAQREALRLGVDLKATENDTWFRKMLAEIRDRQLEDERRLNDPAVVEDTAINYWFNTSLVNETIERLGEIHRITFANASTILTEHANSFRMDGRYGAGAKAVAENRQVYFDTSEVGLADMLTYARRMVDEALEQSAGLYVPLHDQLIEAA